MDVQFHTQTKINCVLLQIHGEIRECVAITKKYDHLFIDIVQGFPVGKLTAHEKFCQTNCSVCLLGVIPLSEASKKNYHLNVDIKATHIFGLLLCHQASINIRKY